ncbi:MAG: bifunctional nuclease family protein [Acidimicrobiales bacterium]
MIAMELMGLQVEPDTGAPIVLLREATGLHRILPVHIGTPEAIAIAVGMEGAMTSRPLTHDLLIDVLESAATRLQRVDVTELVDGTYHAELELHGPSGVQRVSSRPSDAIALAVRIGAPIFADEAVLDEAGLEVVEIQEVEIQEVGGTPMTADEIDTTVEEFTSFLDAIDPADFASPDPDSPDPDSPSDEEPS